MQTFNMIIDGAPVQSGRLIEVVNQIGRASCRERV